MAGTQQRRRFYLCDKRLSINATRYEWLNEASALVNRNRSGRHEHVIPGWNRRIWSGLPTLVETPRLRLRPIRGRLLDYYGYGPYYISRRAKALLCRFDADAFEMVECETVDGRGRAMEPFWMMAVARVVHAFDEERSNFIRYAERNPEAPEAATNPAISALNDLHMPPGFPDDWHAFQLSRYYPQFIMDGPLVDAWNAAKLKGARFTPLQTPTAREFRRHVGFYNYPYWTRKGRQP